MKIQEAMQQLVGLWRMCGDDPDVRVELETDAGYVYGGPVTDVVLTYQSDSRTIEHKVYGARLVVRCAAPRIDAARKGIE